MKAASDSCTCVHDSTESSQFFSTKKVEGSLSMTMGVHMVLLSTRIRQDFHPSIGKYCSSLALKFFQSFASSPYHQVKWRH